MFRRQGYQRTIGIKSAVAILFKQRFVKSKRITTSNWAQHPLEPRQLLYAANDAWVALQVLHALGLPEHQLPVWADGVPPPAEASSGTPRTPAADRLAGPPDAGTATVTDDAPAAVAPRRARPRRLRPEV